MLHLAHVFQELVRQQADVGLVQPGQRKDISHTIGHDGVVQNLLAARCSSSRLRFLSTVVNLLMAALMAAKKAISWRSAMASSSVPHKRKRFAHGRHHIERNASCRPSRPSMWLAAGTSSEHGLRSNAL
ncbi:MAG: hypothetical protein U5K74_08175 [Gemmatimonadaceae bacterium]|nr:hypothetical protein [Gemmatimonadaceae bacterium]